MLIATLICLSTASLATAQGSMPTSYTLSATLSKNGLSSFQSYLNQFPSLLQQLNDGNVTILAPSNAAIDAYLKSSDAPVGNYSENLQALLQYHVIKGHYPRALLAHTPLFLPTLASDSILYVNVTGDQRIEVFSSGQKTVFQSGFKRNSTLISADFLYGGASSNGSIAGVIHVVDRLLTLPEDQITTAQRTGLANFLGLIAIIPSDLRCIGNHDWTIFAPNGTIPSPTNYSTEQLFSIQAYHLVKEVVYSPDLTNGKSLATSWGPDVTITVQDGDTYINDAKILATDYLISMGVMHVIDRPLSPQNTSARPPPPSWRTDLPTGAYISVGIGAALVAIAAGALLWYLIQQRKRREEQNPFERNQRTQVPELANSTPKFAELQAKHGESELKAKSPVYYELGHGRSETNARDQVFELGSG